MEDPIGLEFLETIACLGLEVPNCFHVVNCFWKQLLRFKSRIRQVQLKTRNELFPRSQIVRARARPLELFLETIIIVETITHRGHPIRDSTNRNQVSPTTLAVFRSPLLAASADPFSQLRLLGPPRRRAS